MLRDCALLVEVFSPEIHQPILETLGGSRGSRSQALKGDRARRRVVELPISMRRGEVNRMNQENLIIYYPLVN